MLRQVRLGLGVVLLCAATCLAQGVITTIAGTDFAFPFRSGPALDAPLGQLWKLASDAQGNVYIPDVDNARVFRHSPSNNSITVIAGNGLFGRSGDGGAAVNASLGRPMGVALDQQGNLYIADGNVVRRVTPSGIISTVAGTGAAGFSGDGGPALQARFNWITDVAADSAGNLYVADQGNRRIRRISAAGTVSTVAGNGNSGYSGDGGPATGATFDANEPAVLVDANSNFYFVANERVRKVTVATGIVTTVAGGGTGPADGRPATQIGIPAPADATFDSAGNLYVTNPDTVYKVTPDGAARVIAGGRHGYFGDGGPATAAAFVTILGVATDAAGNVYLADANNNRLRRVTPAGIIDTVAGNGNYRFSGDGNRATSAAFRTIGGIARRTDGSLYVSDQSRVRRIGADGVVTTYAGTGVNGFSGDGGPASQARFFLAAQVATDSAGNLYVADFNNERIRKITPAGIITTVAGGGSQAPVDGAQATSVSLRGQIGALAVDSANNIYILTRGAYLFRVSATGILTRLAGTGTAGFSGDGGAATQAMIGDDFHGGVVVDAGGNVFFSDFQNHRVRRIATNGVITTFAGSGTTSSNGDGGPAASAGILLPRGLAFDASGALLIAEWGGHRVRRVAGGTITTIAGTGSGVNGGDGRPAAQAAVGSPNSVLVEPDGSVLIATDRGVRKILAGAPTLLVAPNALSFSGRVGGAAPIAQQFAVTSNVAGVSWTATTSGASWLSLSLSSGVTPSNVQARVDTTNLAAGSYQATITVASAVAPPQTVGVTLAVEAGRPAQLSLEPESLNFAAIAGRADPVARVVRVNNAGDGSLAWTSRVTTANGGAWLSVSANSGTATATAPSVLQVSARIAGLAPGSYSGAVHVDSAATGGSRLVAVSLAVTQEQAVLLVSQTGLSFNAVEGGGVDPSLDFSVINVGSGAMNWTLEAFTAGGGNWLKMSRTSGTSTGPAADVPVAEASVDLGGLKSGVYSGLIKVDAPGAVNSPQYITVVLNVLPPGSVPPLVVRPANLVFIRAAGSTSPGSQTLKLSSAATSALEAFTGVVTRTGGNWLTVSPPVVTLSRTQSPELVVQPDIANLAPGEYFGVVTLLFTNNSSHTVNVLFVVTPAAQGAGQGIHEAASADAAENSSACQAQKLLLAFRSLGGGFSSSVAYPKALEAEVRDDCDTPATGANVTASFSNGDPPVVLTGLANGLYTGTWVPTRPATPVRITVRATRTGLAPAEVEVQGQLGTAAALPRIFAAGIVNGASFAKNAPVAAGSIISLFGSAMADPAPAAAQGLPLPTTLGGVAVNIGGRDAPLFYSSTGQINAQVPFDLAPGTRPHVLLRVTTGGSQMVSVPEPITLDAARPGIFTVNAEGQGAILDTAARIVDSRAPAAANEVVVVYATGLGATNPAVPTGEPTPFGVLSHAVVGVQATVGGLPAAVHFAGLTPGFVGLYQVNVQIPAGVAAGNAVPLVLTQNGVASNTATLAVK